MAARAGARAEVDSTTIAETGKSPLSVGATIVINDKNKGGVANNNKKSSFCKLPFISIFLQFHIHYLDLNLFLIFAMWWHALCSHHSINHKTDDYEH